MEVAANVPINLFTYAQGLLAIEGESHEAEADELFQRALRLAPTGELAEKIKHHQRRLAERVLRTNAQDQPRMDAVMYLSSALETYRERKGSQAVRILRPQVHKGSDTSDSEPSQEPENGDSVRVSYRPVCTATIR